MITTDRSREAIELRIMSWEEDTECTPCNVQQLIEAAGIIRELYSKWNASRADMVEGLVRVVSNLKFIRPQSLKDWQDDAFIDEVIAIIRSYVKDSQS